MRENFSCTYSQIIQYFKKKRRKKISKAKEKRRKSREGKNSIFEEKKRAVKRLA